MAEKRCWLQWIANLGVLLTGLSGAISRADEAGAKGVIDGIVVDGANANRPLPNTEVVLRVLDDGQLVPLKKTRSDSAGRFSFSDLPLEGPAVFAPGANREQIHYPGPRLFLSPSHREGTATVVTYPTIETPSPLVCRHHEWSVRALNGVLECREVLQIENPTQATFVGKAVGERTPVTLRLSLPAGFETVTFDKEFFGRQFQIVDDRLITDVPWTPGKRELAFTYRLPIESQAQPLSRTLDLPTEQLQVHIASSQPGEVICNLPAGAGRNFGERDFEHRGTILPAGFVLEMQLGKLPAPFMSYGRTSAVVVLSILVAAAAWWSRRMGKHGSDQSRTYRVDQAAAGNGVPAPKSLARFKRRKLPPGEGRRAA